MKKYFIILTLFLTNICHGQYFYGVLGKHAAVVTANITYIGGVGAGQTSGSGNVTTAGLNTTGATLEVATVASYHGATLVAVSDSKGNTWTIVGSYYNTAEMVWVATYYCYVSPSGTSTSQTFSTVGGTGTYPSINVQCFSGTTGTSVDAYTGSDGGSTGMLNTGSITPSINGELIIASLSANETGGGFTGYNITSITGGFSYIEAGAYSGSAFFNAGAYYIQPTAASVSCVFDWTYQSGGSGQGCGMIAAFH